VDPSEAGILFRRPKARFNNWYYFERTLARGSIRRWETQTLSP